MKHILHTRPVDNSKSYYIANEEGYVGRAGDSTILAIEGYCTQTDRLLGTNRLAIYGSFEAALTTKLPEATILATFDTVTTLKDTHQELFL